MKYQRTLIYLLIALWLVTPCIAFADDCTSVAAGATQNITGPDSVCKQVYNGTGAELCVMTYSTQEWQSFYNNPPPSVTAIACPAVSCSSPCGTIANGATCTAYAASSVACGSTCSSQTRTCSNGSLSGSYGYSSCSVNACASCAASGGCPLTSNGGSCLTYTTSNVYNLCPSDLGDECDNASTLATCNNGTWSGTISPYSNCTLHFITCFVGETPVTMADGTVKRIDELQIGDAVRGRSGINHVLRTTVHTTDETLYGFNGGKAFVTGGHPFWTQDGWKAVDPSLTAKEYHNVTTAKLEVGDTLFLDDGATLVIASIDQDNSGGMQQVFNPVMNGDNTYYANRFLVHNKPMCP